MTITSPNQTLAGAVSRNEAAAFLGISTRYLDKQVKAGRLRRCKIGRKSLFRLSDLNAFLSECLEDHDAETEKGGER